MKDICRDWMEFCEYAPEEMDKEYPRIREAFKRLTLEETDIRRGKERAIKYFQCNLRGMRMILGCLVRTCVDMILSKDEGKLKFFFEMPMGMIGPVLGAASLVRDDVVVACPGMYHELLMGNFFDKYDFLIRFAEDRALPQGVSHCGCNQAKYALKGMGMVPVADLNISTGNYCDEAPKADEGIAREFGERQVYMYRPQDEYLYEPPGQGEHLEYFAASIDLVRQELADVVGAEITDDMVKKSLHPYLLMAAELKKLEEIRAHAEPQVLRSAVHDFVWASYMFSPGMQGHERRMEALRVLIEELNGMMAREEGVVEKGAPRVMYGPFNSFVTPGIGHTLEEAGINLCCFEAYGNPNVSPEEMALMIENTPASVIIAMMWLCYPMIFLNSRIASMKASIDKAGNMDGILMLAHHACRIFGSDMLMMKKALKEDMKVEIPIVIVEYDIYDPKYYNAEQIGNRLESFTEVVKVYKASKALASSKKH